MGRSPSLVVIDIINVLGVALGKTENHPPVSPNGHGPKTFHLAFERMQPKPRQVHMGNGRRGMERSQNIPQLGDVFPVYAARVVLFKKPFQSLVSVSTGSFRNVMCHVSHVNIIILAGSHTFACWQSVRPKAERVARALLAQMAMRTDRRYAPMQSGKLSTARLRSWAWKENGR
jgi:hypothetical protein